MRVCIACGNPIARIPKSNIDDHGIELGHRVVVERKPLHHARPELLDDDIRAFHQELQPGPFGRVLGQGRDTALAAIEEREAGAVAPAIRRMEQAHHRRIMPNTCQSRSQM